jgi:hypothetical protein
MWLKPNTAVCCWGVKFHQEIGAFEMSLNFRSLRKAFNHQWLHYSNGAIFSSGLLNASRGIPVSTGYW